VGQFRTPDFGFRVVYSNSIYTPFTIIVYRITPLPSIHFHSPSTPFPNPSLLPPPSLHSPTSLLPPTTNLLPHPLILTLSPPPLSFLIIAPPPLSPPPPSLGTSQTYPFSYHYPSPHPQLTHKAGPPLPTDYSFAIIVPVGMDRIEERNIPTQANPGLEWATGRLIL